MKSFALILALFWSAQALVCLPPEFASRGEGGSTRGDGSSVDHHQEHPEAAVRFDEASKHHSSNDPNSHGSKSNHHSDSDGQCERHCASLDQSVVATSPGIVVPAASGDLLISNSVPVVASIQGLARKIDAFEIGLPPPDRLALISALRI